MLEERAKAGATSLAAWLSRCRMSMGEVKKEKLMEDWCSMEPRYGAVAES